MENTNLVSVFSSQNIAVIGIAKSILDENHIKYFVQNEYSAYNAINTPPFELQVLDKDADNAAALLSDIEEEQSQFLQRFDKKYQPYLGYILIGAILLIVFGGFFVFALLK
jgi:hypothetical protein